jgi:ABC-type Fe3+ transport system permease subunit
MTVSVVFVVRVALGVMLILVGLIGVTLGVLGVIDPVGSKMADDNDPLGVPHSLLESLLIAGAFAAVLVTGCWMTFLRRRPKTTCERPGR